MSNFLLICVYLLFSTGCTKEEKKANNNIQVKEQNISKKRIEKYKRTKKNESIEWGNSL